MKLELPKVNDIWMFSGAGSKQYKVIDIYKCFKVHVNDCSFAENLNIKSIFYYLISGDRKVK